MALELSSKERALLREKSLVFFEDRIICEAQPPISDAVLAKVAARCSGPVPDGLVALWRTAFGGTVDYDISADFGGTIASISFRELFYPESDGYHDLWGWIDHAAELAEDHAKERGRPWSGKIDYLPFGGFEYCSRMYVCVARGRDHGSVVAWEQGLSSAWSLRLHRDSTATIGPDIAALFGGFAFDDDPGRRRTSIALEPSSSTRSVRSVTPRSRGSSSTTSGEPFSTGGAHSGAARSSPTLDSCGSRSRM